MGSCGAKAGDAGGRAVERPSTPQFISFCIFYSAACRIKYISFIFYSLQLMLFIEFEAGGRTLYSCTHPASADACAQTSPAHPEAQPSCKAVDRWAAGGQALQNCPPGAERRGVDNCDTCLTFLLPSRRLPRTTCCSVRQSLGLVQDPASQSDAIRWASHRRCLCLRHLCSSKISCQRFTRIPAHSPLLPSSHCCRNAFILLGMLLALRIAVYWVLRRKTARL